MSRQPIWLCPFPAEELGYTVGDLAPVEVGQVEGSASAWLAKKPCAAFVDGLPDIKFEIKPLFVASLNALWGRADLMIGLHDQRLGEISRIDSAFH